MKKKDIIQLVKDAINEIGADAYGDATLTSQGQSKSRFTKTGRPPGVMEFQQPKSFDPDTLALVREMLSMADIHYNELVGEDGEISSFLDKRSGGTFFKFPHFNAGPGMFGKETTARINASKAKAKSAALKTYTQFKEYIEDYEISDASPTGVYGKIYLFVMFNESAKDYTAPKGGTQSSQFEEYENDSNIKFINKFTPPQRVIDMYNENPHLKKSLSSLSKYKKIQAIAQLQTHFSTSKDRDMIKKEDRFDSSLAEIIEAWADDYYKDSDFFSYGMYVDKDYFDFFNANKDLLLKKYKKQQIPYNREIDEAPMFKTDVKQDMAPEGMAGRIKKVFDKVNGAKDPVKTPEWHKNRFKNKYGISFPEVLKGINKDQALAMNKYANDMTIKEEEGSVTTNDAAEAEKLAKKGVDVKLTDMNEENNINNENMDHEGRMAKSQMYKMQDYVKKLSMMLDDGAQLPGWVQSKLTKASDYMSSVFHYLEYEMVRGQDNLNEHVNNYKKRAVLMEGAMKKFFEMFDRGMTDEEVVLDYAQKGTQIPEMFVNKARKQYEGLKKMKLELEISEKEYKNSATQIVNNPATNEMDGSTTMETKKLATDLFNEDLDPVGQEDDDIDNDGKSNTKTDKYLKNKRAKTSAAINKNKTK
jgi:hypothetical protein